MALLVILSSDVHITALRTARDVGKGAPLPSNLMNAMLDEETSSWIGRIWDDVEAALGRGYYEGIQAARPYIEKVSVHLIEVASNLAQRADEVRAVITARLNTYLQQAIDGALQRVRPTISVGGHELMMATVTVEQKIKLSGSLKASLEEICEFVAEGEISLSAEYVQKNN
jgi:hypothetical protein